MYTKQAELKAGILVVVAIAALLALLFVATGESIFGASRYLHVRFEQGRVVPQVGDAVMMNGVDIGHIDEIRQQSEIRSGDRLTPKDKENLAKISPDAPQEVREIYVLAVAKLPADQVVPEGTTAEIKTELTGARNLYFIAGLSLHDMTDEASREHPIPGREAAGLESIGQKAAELLDSVGKVATQGSAIMLDVRQMIAALRGKIDAIDAVAINKNVLEATESMRSALLKVDARIEEIATNLGEASKDIKKATSQGAATVANAEKDLAALGQTLNRIADKLDRLIDKAEPKVLAFLDDLQGLGKSLSALAKEFTGIGPEARRLITDLGSDLDQITRPLVDASHNIADASEDIRAHPWKLLNKPDAQDIAYENVRGAAFNYARAMRDMELAAETLNKILARPDIADPEIRAAAQRALAEFQTSRDRYREAEKRFQELLGGRVPPPR